MRCRFCQEIVDCVIECHCETSRINLAVFMDKLRSFRNTIVLYCTDARTKSMLSDNFITHLNTKFTKEDFRYLYRIYGIEGYRGSKERVVDMFYQHLRAGELRIQPYYSNDQVPNDLREIRDRYTLAQTQYQRLEQERIERQEAYVRVVIQQNQARQQAPQPEQLEQERRERHEAVARIRIQLNQARQQAQAQQRVQEEALATAIVQGRVNQRVPQPEPEWISVQHPPLHQPPIPAPRPSPKLKLNFIQDSDAVLNKEDDNTCCICLEEIDSKTMCKTSCGHLYHHKCIVSAMKTMNHHKHDCPMCRKRVEYISVTKDVGFDIMTKSKQSVVIQV